MYERMLDKNTLPDDAEIQAWIGARGCELLAELDAQLRSRYDIVRETRFPFGNNYGWCYKYSHKSNHLCHAFFEKGAFTVMIQLGDALVPAMEAALPSLSETVRELWENRYPCGEKGGWMQYRILSDEDLNDAVRLIQIKKKLPARRK